MLKHPRLKVKLILIQFLTILPFLIFIFYIFDLWYDTRRAQILEKNTSEAKFIAEIIKNELNYAQNLSLILAHNTNFHKYLLNNRETAHKTLKNITDTSKEINAIVITDPIGRPISASFEITPDEEQTTLTDRDYFQEMLKKKDVVVSPQILGRFSQKNIVIAAAPIIANNEVVAAVLTSYEIESLKKKIEDNLPPNNNDRLIFVIEKNGRLSFQVNKPFYKDSDRVFLNDKFYINPPLERGKIALIDNQSLPPYLTEKAMGASVPVDKFGWVVISVEPTNVIFAPLFKIQSATWLIIFFALIFSVAVSSFFLKKIKIVY